MDIFRKPETVKIKVGNGYGIINKDDFVEGVHQLYEEQPVVKSWSKKKKVEPVEKFVEKPVDDEDD